MSRDELKARGADQRQWLATSTETPTDLLAAAWAIADNLALLHCALTDEGYAHGWLCEFGVDVGLTDAEYHAARAHLALHHEVVDVIASAFERCWSHTDRSPVPAIREELHRVFSTDGLAAQVHGDSGHGRRAS